jgi:hypothetical protein
MVRAALDKAGGEEYLARQALAEPASFLALVGQCLPRDLNLKGSGVLEVRIIDPTRRRECTGSHVQCGPSSAC